MSRAGARLFGMGLAFLQQGRTPLTKGAARFPKGVGVWIEE